MLKTAIVILNWNGIEYLKKFLGGVVNNSVLPGTGIYVADNGSTDGSVEWVTQNFPAGTACFICLRMRSSCEGPPEQLTPITSAPSSWIFRATVAGSSPSKVRSSRVKVTDAIMGRAQVSFAALMAS